MQCTIWNLASDGLHLAAFQDGIWLYTLRFSFFCENSAAYYLTVGPKIGRRERKIDVPTDNIPEFELGDTAADIQQMRLEGEQRRGRRHSNRGKKRHGGRWQERRNHTCKRRGIHEKGPGPKKVTLKPEPARGEAGPSQSCFKKEHMTNIYLTDSDKETTVVLCEGP